MPFQTCRSAKTQSKTIFTRYSPNFFSGSKKKAYGQEILGVLVGQCYIVLTKLEHEKFKKISANWNNPQAHYKNLEFQLEYSASGHPSCNSFLWTAEAVLGLTFKAMLMAKASSSETIDFK